MRFIKSDSGSTRIVRKFLFLPVAVDKEIRWLEIATMEQEYVSSWADSGWETIRFIDDKETT